MKMEIKTVENLLEIIDPCINKQNEEDMMDYFDIIYDAIVPFIEEDEKKNFYVFMKKIRKKKLNIIKIY